MPAAVSFVMGVAIMAIFFANIQKSPNKEEIAAALKQRDIAINILVDEINKLKKKK